MRSSAWTNPALEQTFVASLTNVPSAQILESRTQRSIDIVILSQELILPRVADRIEFVTPMAYKVEPLYRCLGCEVGAPQLVFSVVVCERMDVEQWVPEWASVCFVMKDAAW
jgi:hypothetical protein